MHLNKTQETAVDAKIDLNDLISRNNTLIYHVTHESEANKIDVVDVQSVVEK